MARFSTRYKTFHTWKQAMPRTSTYASRILRLHQLNPTAKLTQLRTGKNLVTSFGNAPYEYLTRTQKVEYKHALEVLRLMRTKNQSLRSAATRVGLSPTKVLRYIGHALKKTRGRYLAKKADTLYRKMHLFEKGKRTTITVTNSHDASLIGQYFSAVGKLAYHHDKTALEQFKDITITDADGRQRTFETNPDAVLLILDRMEDLEFFEIYANE